MILCTEFLPDRTAFALLTSGKYPGMLLEPDSGKTCNGTAKQLPDANRPDRGGQQQLMHHGPCEQQSRERTAVRQ